MSKSCYTIQDENTRKKFKNMKQRQKVLQFFTGTFVFAKSKKEALFMLNYMHFYKKKDDMI